jgi:hypothetical protein
MHRPQHQQHQAYQQQHPQQPRTACPVVASLVTLGALVLAGALFGVDAVRAPTVYAAPSRQTTSVSASSETFGIPHEMSKTILSETSIDGPAMWTLGPAGPSAAGIFLGWTGTDAAHHVNYMGMFPSTPKVTMRETSVAHPAVVNGGTNQGGDFIAWTGTDSFHHLNIECVTACGAATNVKVTLQETSGDGPTLLRLAPQGLLLGWTGTDANHSLNLLPVSINGAPGHEHWDIGNKSTLPQFSSIAGPSLALQPNGTGPGIFVPILLCFALPSGRIGFATSIDQGLHWTMPSASPLHELTAVTPNMFGAIGTTPNNWLTWTGTDAAHHVNVQFTTSFPSWPPAGTKATLPETALGGPAMGFAQMSPTTSQFVVAWTGTDAAHHLNIAVIGV